MPRNKQKQPLARKSVKKIIRRRVVRLLDAATRDSGAIRFGSGCGPAILRK